MEGVHLESAIASGLETSIGSGIVNDQPQDWRPTLSTACSESDAAATEGLALDATGIRNH